MTTTTDFDWAQQKGHGRQAEAPQQVPAKGWKDIAVRVFHEIGDDRVTLVAAGVTYFLLLAIFPALTALVSVYGLFADPASVGEHLAMLSGVLPAGGMEIVNEQLSSLAAQGTPSLGLALILSLGLALWSASAGVKALFEAMNVVYDEKEARGFFKLNALALLFTLASVVAAMAMIGVVVAMPLALSLLGLGGRLEWLLQIGGYALLVVLLFTGIAALYRFGPSRQQAQWRWITPGAVMAVLIIIAASLLFSWYAANFANYDKTYGSLGALIGFLTWMWISITVVVVGAEINAEIEHQTAKDSTIGKTSPMGQRDATMADTVGAPAEQAGGETAHRDKNEDWRAGFEAGRRQNSARRAGLPLTLALPAALALEAMSRNGHRR